MKYFSRLGFKECSKNWAQVFQWSFIEFEKYLCQVTVPHSTIVSALFNLKICTKRCVKLAENVETNSKSTGFWPAYQISLRKFEKWKVLSRLWNGALGLEIEKKTHKHDMCFSRWLHLCNILKCIPNNSKNLVFVFFRFWTFWCLGPTKSLYTNILDKNLIKK